MATLYNNGSGNQSMGNMDAQMAAAKEAYMKAQLEGNPQAYKVVSENYHKSEALQADKNRDIARAEKVGQDNSDIKVAQAQEQIKNDNLANNANFKPLEAYKNELADSGNLTVDNNLLKEYGNNYFELITYDQGLNNNKLGGQLKLAGVLKELPSFSMTTTWAIGPAKSISDTVKDTVTSPLLEMMTTIGGRDRAWMSLDEGTDRTYQTVTRPTFTLNFKLYTNEVIGSQKLTEWKTWLKALSLYTMPSVDAKVSVNAMANNALNGLYGSIDLVKDAFNSFSKGFSDSWNKESGATSDKTLIDSVRDAITAPVEGAANGLQTAADTVGGRIAERDGENRVINSSNTKNYYGAKLWYLRLLPGIFKKPLIVYISSWNVTYSKEITPIYDDKGNIVDSYPIWVEYSITCEMDQIASAPVWMKYLTGTDKNIPIYSKD